MRSPEIKVTSSRRSAAREISGAGDERLTGCFPSGEQRFVPAADPDLLPLLFRPGVNDLFETGTAGECRFSDLRYTLRDADTLQPGAVKESIGSDHHQAV